MKRISRELVLLVILVVPLAQGASAAASADQNESLDTVVVEGRLHQLETLREEMILVEDRFYERYNALNPVRDFDTHCYFESLTGTRTRARYCRAVYQEKAQEREGQDYAEALKTMLGDGDTTDPKPWVPPTPSTVVIEARRKDYRQNIRNVVKSNPELIELLRQRYELGQRYEATRRAIFKHGEPDDPDKNVPEVPATP